jgi:predicted phosphoribosyltransferase
MWRSTPPFRDRDDAGRQLGRALAEKLGRRDGVIVLGLPRGGVPVAWHAAQALGASLDVFIVRKLGVPGHEELAMGAIASGGVRVMNRDVLDYMPIPQQMIDSVAEREQREVERREREYRGARPPLDVRGKSVVIVDDGLATGSTMRAAVRALRAMEPRAVIVAVPVAAAATCEEFRRDPDVDDIVCLRTPEPFQAVGLWYEDFAQTSDDEVHELLGTAAQVQR